jgi:glycosyltransferase involved in cell wall biosynthesis
MNTAPIALDTRTASAHFPGIGRYATGLARALARQTETPGVILLHGLSPDPRLPLFALPGIACSASPFDVRQQWEMRRVLRACGARLYHSPYFLMPFAPGVRAVVTCYDMIPLIVPGLFGPARRLAYRLAHTLAFRAASAIIVPSDATRDDVSRLFPGHAPKVEVLPIGWEFAATESEDQASRLRQQLGVPDEYLLSVGSNRPHKNLRVLVDAWTEVVNRNRGLAALPPLVLVGPRDARFDEGGPRIDHERQAGHLISLGPVSDAALAALYRGATLFVFPSLAEGFGLPVIEAMGCGAPVACSRIPALMELSGDAAALFDPNDAAALTRLLEHLLASPAERDTLRQAGLARAAAFTWERAARSTAALYARILGERT